jgi:serine protease AprX
MVMGAAIRRGGALALALSTAFAGAAVLQDSAPAQAAVVHSSGQWLWEGTPKTVSNLRWDLNLDAFPAGVSLTGKGVGIALIDTGVAPVAGLKSGNVVNGPDLSFDSQDPAKRYVDGFGHGTHLAGIISAKTTAMTGLAPDAKLTSIKVGASNGAVDVSQVIAGIDWAVAHRKDDSKNPIRVLVLAYGTDGVQRYQIDPLSAAVENAWRAGITVVVSGGNRGPGAKLLNPATNPFVIAVGASDDKATTPIDDDTVADFSSVGDSSRRIDFVAPGRSVASLRAPGSYIDTNYPAARLGTDFFLGSGSSQAAAVTGAVAADLLQAYPSLTPNQLKDLFKWSATRVGPAAAPSEFREINAYWAWDFYKTYTSSYTVAATEQKFSKSTGTGSLEASRGSVHVSDGASVLTGEKDIFGSFSTKSWATASASQKAWSGGRWMGRDWTGTGWVTSSSGLSSWDGRAWSGRAWSGRAWSGDNWVSMSWNGAGWG